jgi:hypothetical protein
MPPFSFFQPNTISALKLKVRKKIRNV